MKRRAQEPVEPRRTCVGCRRVAGPSELVRIARRSDGMLVAEPHEPGRGAWLCRGSLECFDAATRRRAFARSLRAEVTPEATDALRARLFSSHHHA